jgi:hypothetical protein
MGLRSIVRLAGQAPRFFVQDNEQEEGFSGFFFIETELSG